MVCNLRLLYLYLSFTTSLSLCVLCCSLSLFPIWKHIYLLPSAQWYNIKHSCYDIKLLQLAAHLKAERGVPIKTESVKLHFIKVIDFLSSRSFEIAVSSKTYELDGFSRRILIYHSDFIYNFTIDFITQKHSWWRFFFRNNILKTFLIEFYLKENNCWKLKSDCSSNWQVLVVVSCKHLMLRILIVVYWLE